MKNRLKALRMEKDLTLDEIQNQTGIKRGTYSNYENGITEPKIDTWEKLANFFEVSVPYLQGLDQIWYQAECLECHKVFRISSQDADKVNCCPFCKEFYLSISKAN